MSLVSGNDQTGIIQSDLAEPFVIKVTDGTNNPVEGWPVKIKVLAGGGKFGGADSVQVTTDASGEASVTLTLGTEAGTPANPFNNRVAQDFVSLLTVRLRGKGCERLAAGTIFGRTQPRIVRVDNFLLEAVPEGATLLIRNDDRPGVVGAIGSVLGEAGVNISRMQLGLNLAGTEALQLLNVDPAPDESVLDAVRSLPGIQSAQLLDLGAKVT